MFQTTKQVGQAGLKASLQIERGEMKVACLREEIEIKIGDGNLGDGARVGEPLPRAAEE